MNVGSEPGCLGWIRGVTMKKLCDLRGHAAALSVRLPMSNLGGGGPKHVPLRPPFGGHQQYVAI